MRALDQLQEVGSRGDDDAHVEADREPEVVRGDDIRRVCDRDQDDVLGEEANRQRLVAARVFLRQERRGRRIQLDPVQVEELEPVLLGEQARELGSRDPAVGEDDLADAGAGLLLLGERELELLRREQAVANEQRAERHPRRVRRERQSDCQLCGQGRRKVGRGLHRPSIGLLSAIHESRLIPPAGSTPEGVHGGNRFPR